MWDALEVRNNLTKTIAKKLAVVLFVVAITLVVTAGCSPKPVEAIESPTTANTPISPEPKPTPPMKTKSPRELELEAFLEKAPEIEGLTKFIEDDKIIYKNEQGEYSGYYVEKAYYNGEETDGVSLSAEVIEGIVSKNREEGLDGSLAMPVDPSEGQVVKVEFLQEKLISGILFKNGVIMLSADKLITVTNSLYENRQIIREITSFKDEPTVKNDTYSEFVDGDKIAGGYRLRSLDFLYINTNIPRQESYNISTGESLGQTEGGLMLMKYYKTVDDLNKYFIYESEILKIDNSLVFFMVNESPNRFFKQE